MKKLVVILTVFLACAFSSNAQKQESFSPSWKISALGGINYATSDEWAINFFSHVTPNGQLGVEYTFLPWLGVRGTLSGPLGAYPVNEGKGIGKFSYVQLGADAMFDFANMFGYKSTRFAYPYLFLGFSALDRFKANGAGNYFGLGARGGIGVNIRLGDALKLVLEVQENALNNKFNTLDDNMHYGAGKGRYRRVSPFDDNLAALAGLQWELGAGKRRAAEAAAAERRATAQAAAAAAAQATADRLAAARAAAEEAYAERLAALAAAEQMNSSVVEERVLFDPDRSIVPSRESGKVRHIISVLNQNPDAIVVVTGFAERSTTGAVTMTLAHERVEVIKLTLTDAGISPDRIITNYYGDPSLLPADTADPSRIVLISTR